MDSGCTLPYTQSNEESAGLAGTTLKHHGKEMSSLLVENHSHNIRKCFWGSRIHQCRSKCLACVSVGVSIAETSFRDSKFHSFVQIMCNPIIE